MEEQQMHDGVVEQIQELYGNRPYGVWIEPHRDRNQMFVDRLEKIFELLAALRKR